MAGLVSRRKFFGTAAATVGAISVSSRPDLFAQGLELGDQSVDLQLLAIDRPIQFIHQVFGIADLDFKIGQA